MRRTRPFLAAIAIITVIGGCSKIESTKAPASDEAAERTPTVGTGGAGANVDSDSDFVHDVASKNLAEIDLSRMALNKTSSSNVKAFAQMMIDEHGAAASTLKSIVTGQAIEWPARLDEKHRETAEELGQKQGVDFEREYLKAMIESHQNLAAKLESRLDVQSLADWKTAAAARAQSKAMPEPNDAMRDVAVRPSKSDNDITMKINQWAADTYPVAQKHLDTARLLENAVKKRSTN